MAVEKSGTGAGKAFGKRSTLVLAYGDMRPPGKKRILPCQLVVVRGGTAALRGPGGRVWTDRPVALRVGVYMEGYI